MFLISSGTIAIIVVAVVLFILVVWFISTMNSLRKMNEKVNEAESGIDVALTKRFDALTKMLDVTKGYAKHEAETLENVIKWRNGLPQDATLAEKKEFAEGLNKLSNGIDVLVERYPDLKADKMFSNLQASVMDVEEHLQAARRLYNANVSTLNQLVISFPQSIVASMCKVAKREYFEAEDKKREDVSMSF